MHRPKENINGNYLDHHFGFVVARCAPNLALQRQLGILSKRWLGTDSADRGDTRVDRQGLTEINLKDLAFIDLGFMDVGFIDVAVIRAAWVTCGFLWSAAQSGAWS